MRGGVDAGVIGLDDLETNTRAAGRQQDRADLDIPAVIRASGCHITCMIGRNPMSLAPGVRLGPYEVVSANVYEADRPISPPLEAD